MPDTHLAGVRGRVSEAEWQARLDCAAVYRLLAIYGMSDLVYNHVTLRVPGEGDRLLINPFGWLYEEVTASSLITINLEGGVMLNPHPDVGINPAGYVIHSAVHAVRPDAACVDPYAQPGWHSRVGHALRPAAAVPDRDALHAGRLPRLRGPSGGPRRAWPAPAGLGGPALHAAAQPRPADHRAKCRRGVQWHVLARNGLPRPGGCNGGAG